MANMSSPSAADNRTALNKANQAADADYYGSGTASSSTPSRDWFAGASLRLGEGGGGPRLGGYVPGGVASAATDASSLALGASPINGADASPDEVQRVVITGRRERLVPTGQFTDRFDTRIAIAGPSGLTKPDGSPATYSFNRANGQAYWDAGEGSLREIPHAYRMPTLDDLVNDPSNPFANQPRIGNVLTDFALYSGAGALVLPASAPVSLGFFGIGVLAGGGVNYSFQRATGPDTKWGDVVNASITGGLTFGKSLVPSLAVNTFGAWTTANLQSDDATVKTLAAIGGTLLGGPVGQLAQTTTRNIAVATAIRYETPTLSLSIASSTLPANATMSSIASESVGLGTDWLNSRDRRPK